jgi:integrator complex subunit 1
MGERLWVDNEECRYFVENLKISLNTRTSPFIPLDFLDTMSTTETALLLPDSNEVSIMSRYGANQTVIENIILDVAKEYLIRRQSTEGISRNLLKLLSVAAGILEVSYYNLFCFIMNATNFHFRFGLWLLENWKFGYKMPSLYDQPKNYF